MVSLILPSIALIVPVPAEIEQRTAMGPIGVKLQPPLRIILEVQSLLHSLNYEIID